MVKSESLGTGLDKKGLLVSTGWVVPLYDETSASMKGWWRDDTAVGSLEDDDKNI